MNGYGTCLFMDIFQRTERKWCISHSLDLCCLDTETCSPAFRELETLVSWVKGALELMSLRSEAHSDGTSCSWIFKRPNGSSIVYFRKTHVARRWVYQALTHRGGLLA